MFNTKDAVSIHALFVYSKDNILVAHGNEVLIFVVELKSISPLRD